MKQITDIHWQCLLNPRHDRRAVKPKSRDVEVVSDSSYFPLNGRLAIDLDYARIDQYDEGQRYRPDKHSKQFLQAFEEMKPFSYNPTRRTKDIFINGELHKQDQRKKFIRQNGKSKTIWVPDESG